MPSDGDASVNPSQPWSQDGPATVTPIPPLPGSARTMPLENRDPGPATVYKSAYPLGLVVIPTGDGPSTTPAILPVYVSSGTSYQITNQDYIDCPEGFVVWFTPR